MTEPTPNPPLTSSPLPLSDSPIPDADDPPAPPSNEQEQQDDMIPYIQAEGDQLLPPPNFAPFFPVVEDTTTGEHYHPAAYYIFNDDDQDIVTAAALRELGSDDDGRHHHTHKDSTGEGDQVEPPSPPPLPPRIPGVKERYLLLDMSADGQKISQAQSLGRDWQITEATTRPAPTWEEETAETGSGRIMLKLSGNGIPKNPQHGEVASQGLLHTARDKAGGDALGSLSVLAEQFSSAADTLAKMTGVAVEQEQQEPDVTQTQTDEGGSTRRDSLSGDQSR